MNKNRHFRTLLALASVAMLTSAAFAGGPLLVDPATKSAYHYDASQPIPVYYDLGNLGVVPDSSTNPPTMVTFDNTVGKKLVEKGFRDWSAIKTSSMRATVVGDFSKIGLPDIDSTNVTDIIGTSKGRGIYVIFDADGSIMQNFFGAGDGILGISSPEFSIAGTTIITESFVVLNGSAIDPADTNALNFQGVATHEFGHSLGMAHTQTNGAAFFYNDNLGPNSCTSLRYANILTSADVETMYPYINPNVGGTGMAQANLHTTDTLAAFSDLYPGRGWTKSYGTITGKVYDLDGKTELTGVNVIARNLADPYVDSTSAMTGQMTQGQLGPDGSFTLHGLKPGAQYVVYVDAIMAGGFPKPPLWFLPGAERFWAGDRGERSYNPCSYRAITANPGKPAEANITFARVPGAPVLYQLVHMSQDSARFWQDIFRDVLHDQYPWAFRRSLRRAPSFGISALFGSGCAGLGYGAFVTGLSGDGSVAVGGYGRGGPIFRWTASQGVQSMNADGVGATVSISQNGRYISSNLLDVNSDTDIGAYRWDAKNGWIRVRPNGQCGTDTNSNFAVSNDGSVFGLSYNTCTDYKAFRWIPNTAIGSIEYKSSFKRSDGKWANSRIDQVSADGSIAVGWQEAEWGGWLGTVWHHGRPELITDENGDPVSEAFTVSGDGETIAGQLFDGQFPFDGSGWRRATNGSKLDYIQPLSADATPLTPYSLSGTAASWWAIAGMHSSVSSLRRFCGRSSWERPT